jgi:hypothetical protein
MNRKRTAAVTLLVLAATTLSPLAQADRPGGHWRDGGRDRVEHHYRAPPSHGHYRGPRVYRDHTGAILGAAAIGSLLWLSTYDRPVSPPPQVVVMPSPPPVVVAPPAPRTPPPPSDVWYYCRSAGAYYPYAQTCTSPWELVPAQ